MKTLLFMLIVLVSGCASTQIDEKTTAKSKIQCPIGYHLEQTGGVVLFAGNKDQNKHLIEFRCVADSNQEGHKNSDVN